MVVNIAYPNKEPCFIGANMGNATHTTRPRMNQRKDTKLLSKTIELTTNQAPDIFGL